MRNNIILLKSTNQFIDVKGNVYTMSPNGNIDDMTEATSFNIAKASLQWWHGLSAHDFKLADIIYGGLQNGKS